MIQKISTFIGTALLAALFLCSCGADAAQQEKIQQLENEVKRLSKAIDNNAEAGKPTNTSLKTEENDASNPVENESEGDYDDARAWDCPEASVRLLTEGDIGYKSSYDLRLMRNEIFARHGYIFDSEDLIEHFGKKSAYRPTRKNVSHLLSDIEKKNVKLIQEMEILHADTPR